MAGAQGKRVVVGDKVGRGHDKAGKCRVMEAIVRRANVIPKATVEQQLHAPQCWELCPWPLHSSPWALREGGREGCVLVGCRGKGWAPEWRSPGLPHPSKQQQMTAPPNDSGLSRVIAKGPQEKTLFGISSPCHSELHPTGTHCQSEIFQSASQNLSLHGSHLF